MLKLIHLTLSTLGKKLTDDILKYSRTSMARTSFGPCNLFEIGRATEGYKNVITAPGQEANGDNLGISFRSSTQ